MTLNTSHTAASQSISFDSQRLNLKEADLLLYPVIGLDAESILHALLTETPWQQESVTLYGKTHPQPRLEAWYGDDGASYSYSGIQHHPLPWTSTLSRLKQVIEAVTNTTFNSVLLNYYRDGADSMGLHADDEPELGDEPTIASLSLGATRRMYFRHRRDSAEPTFSLDLPSGSLLVMAGSTQQYWKHGIRKTRKPCGSRVNLTFRTIVN